MFWALVYTIICFGMETHLYNEPTPKKSITTIILLTVPQFHFFRCLYIGNKDNPVCSVHTTVNWKANGSHWSTVYTSCPSCDQTTYRRQEIWCRETVNLPPWLQQENWLVREHEPRLFISDLPNTALKLSHFRNRDDVRKWKSVPRCRHRLSSLCCG